MKVYMKITGMLLAFTILISSFAGCGNIPFNNPRNIEVIVGDKTTLEINNENNEKVLFSSNNESVARIDESGEITAVGNGEAVITVKIGDNEEIYVVEVIDKRQVNTNKEFEKIKKQLEEVLMENAELKSKISKMSLENPTEWRNINKTEKSAKDLINNPENSDLSERLLSEDVIRLVNELRVNKGLNILTINEELMDKAKMRAAELKEKRSHTRPDGTLCDTIFNGLSYDFWGENVAWGQITSQEV